MGIADRYQIYAEHDAKAVYEAYQQNFAKVNSMLNNSHTMNEELDAKINECMDILKKMNNDKKMKKKVTNETEEACKDWEETIKKTMKKIQEDKKMEKQEEKKQITSKQAIKAIGRNFGRWVKDHKWQIAGCAVGTAIIGSIWHKSAAIVDQEPEQIAKADNWDGNEHYISDEGYFNWKKEPNNTWSAFFCLEPSIDIINIDPKEFDEIMELIKKDYHDDYEAMWDALAEN